MFSSALNKAHQYVNLMYYPGLIACPHTHNALLLVQFHHYFSPDIFTSTPNNANQYVNLM